MKKLTEKKILSDAKQTLFAIPVLLGFFLWQAIQSNDWILFIVMTVLLVLADGYKNTRLLLDKTYRKRYLIKKNDERNVQVENLTYRKMLQILMVGGVFLSGTVFGYLYDELTVEQRGLIVLVIFGFSLAIFGLFHAIKYYYSRQL
ncbi:hypothetical protein AB6M97_08525 [Streptococcus hillyeri]|uniref:Uncharacterized protein n=1 Tax=Streptococcus hillyeri TaxID=2282420 RepID=A0A3L9DU78_9STRE|nr:hypothetical protein [Streptococcus hillyeri]RLY03249.1 hypothetical protein EAF07_05590 [Streptococcus hillyeri]